jgi:hypothetical protein
MTIFCFASDELLNGAISKHIHRPSLYNLLPLTNRFWAVTQISNHVSETSVSSTQGLFVRIISDLIVKHLLRYNGIGLHSEIA